jgi:hypothetical protein
MPEDMKELAQAIQELIKDEVAAQLVPIEERLAQLDRLVAAMKPEPPVVNVAAPIVNVAPELKVRPTQTTMKVYRDTSGKVTGTESETTPRE